MTRTKALAGLTARLTKAAIAIKRLQLTWRNALSAISLLVFPFVGMAFIFSQLGSFFQIHQGRMMVLVSTRRVQQLSRRVY